MASSSPAFSGLSMPTPPQSTLSSRRSSTRSPLSIDLSDLPPLITPSPPTNTLLITNLNDATVFQPDNLQTIRNLINSHVGIYTWSPLKSMRRIIVSFYSTDDATLIRKTLDCETIMGCRVRIYFGAETKIQENQDQHLKAPNSEKMFFISPPPSPPHGWEMRNEDPPNKDVHAEDLAHALARLHAQDRRPSVDEMEAESSSSAVPQSATGLKMRSRSSTLVYHPEHAGDSPALPCIMVDDTSESDHEEEVSPMDLVGRKPITHTSRPPVELMEH